MPRRYPPEVYWSQKRKLASLAEKFRLRVAGIIIALEGKDFDPHVVYGWRSPGTQRRLVVEGFSRTMNSKHCVGQEGEALAVDLIDRNLGWSPKADPFFKMLGKLARSEGLTWGGDWDTFKDESHIEWKEST